VLRRGPRVIDVGAALHLAARRASFVGPDRGHAPPSQPTIPQTPR
jgi:hypothetical protein